MKEERIKKVPTYTKVLNKKVISGEKNMIRLNVKAYFRNIKPHKNLRDGEYCHRCSILIGSRYVNKKPKYWKGFALCKTCVKHKRNKGKENTPDLEDLDRFNIETI